MGIGKILNKVAAQVQNAGKKPVRQFAAQVAVEKIQSPDVILDSMDKMALQKAMGIVRTNTGYNMAEEAINSGLTAQEAVNGIKALTGATNRKIEFNSKSAEASAKAMEEAGLFKKLDEQARKADLQKKYGEKLAQRKAKIAQMHEETTMETEMRKAWHMLNEEMELVDEARKLYPNATEIF